MSDAPRRLRRLVYFPVFLTEGIIFETIEIVIYRYLSGTAALQDLGTGCGDENVHLQTTPLAGVVHQIAEGDEVEVKELVSVSRDRS